MRNVRVLSCCTWFMREVDGVFWLGSVVAKYLGKRMGRKKSILFDERSERGQERKIASGTRGGWGGGSRCERGEGGRGQGQYACFVCGRERQPVHDGIRPGVLAGTWKGP